MRTPSRRCVVLFARSPRAEARRKGLPAAEALFRGVERRLRERVALLPGVALLACEPGTAPDAHRLRQRGPDFATRLGNAFADARARGFQDVLVVPGDVPGLDESLIARAFRRLRGARVVLGPSPDGGVYLLGIRGPADAVLSGVRWCTPHVRRDLQARAPGARLLPGRADVDRAADLQRVRHDEDVPREVRALVSRPPAARVPDAFPLLTRPMSAPDRPRGPPPVA